MKSNTLIAVEWLWSHRGKDLYWRPNVLTPENAGDPSAPKLTTVEAVSIFRLLLEKGLMFQGVDEKGAPAFWMHEGKVLEWRAFIENLKKQESDSYENEIRNVTCGDTAKKAGAEGDNNHGSTDGDASKKTVGFIIELVVAGSVGTGIWVLGEHFISGGHLLAGSRIRFVAFAIYFATVPIAAAKFWKTKGIWFYYVIFCVIMAVVFETVRQHTEPVPLPPKPPSMADLQLYLQIGDDDDTSVLLTNSLSVVTSNTDFGFAHLDSCLVVPIRSNQPNAVLEFVILNRSSISAEQAELWVGIPDDWVWSTTNGWTPTYMKTFLTQRIMGLSTTNKLKFLLCDIPRPLHWNNGQKTASITIEIKNDRWLFMTLGETYKDALTTAMAIEVAFRVVPNPSGMKPFFVTTQTNPDGTRTFSPPDKELHQ